MAAIQRLLYGESAGGWEAEGRPSAAELAHHERALVKDGVALAALLGVYAAAGAAVDPALSEAALAGAAPGEQLARGALGGLCALGAASALFTDLFLTPCPAASDKKWRTLSGIGHFAYLTVQCLALCSTHLALGAAADVALDPLVRPALPPAWDAALVRVHALGHASSEWTASLACVLASLYYPLALGRKEWEEEEVAPWRARGVRAFKPLNLYSHGAAVPCALADLLLVKRRALLRALTPPFGWLGALAALYAVLYPCIAHVSFNVVAAVERRAAQLDAADEGVWPYGFMAELSNLSPPPRALARWGVRHPFSLGWVLLPLAAGSVHLAVIGATRALHKAAAAPEVWA